MSNRVDKYYMGVDIGGSVTKIGLSDSEGVLFGREAFPTEGQKGPDHVVAKISQIVRRLVGEKGISSSSLLGIGIGSPGPLDTKSGTIIHTHNLGWRDVPLRDMVSDATGVPAALDNDANAAAIGEWWKGAGVGMDSLVCFTLGTGVGGGIVIHGEIWRGATDVAGEIGHMTIEVDGRRCSCGNLGCLESYASATAIAARAREGIEDGRETVLKRAVEGDLSRITSATVYQQAIAGDSFCKEIMVETATYLSVGVANILNIINPELVVISGGVIKAGEMLFAPLVDEVRGRAFPAAVQGVRVVPAELGDDAGIIGAVGVIKAEIEGGIVS